jgi:cellulose synthase/poly-beta-1,6-N-acetylglucosamine synthase-like glycosyltransferase
MIFLFYILALLLVYLSWKSFRGGIAYLDYFRREIARPESGHTPFVSVIAPCRGVDEGLRENLQALVEQDYPRFEIVFVVDDEHDPAASVIGEIPGTNAKLFIAGKTTDSSQKVENLREAVQHVSPESEVFVFVDSDARPAKTWLRFLVAPLADDSVGASTGYRWFISERPTFASEMRSVWNASVASALGPNSSKNFCWGGSTAIRRETFERLNVREKWRGTLSDDFALTRLLSEAGLPIHFVPQGVTASVESCTFREMAEFTTRQMKITRVYKSNLWLMSFFGSGLFTVVMGAAFLIVVFSVRNSFAVWAAIATILLVSLFSIGKSWLRLKAVRLVLGQYDRELARQMWTQNTLCLLSPPLFFYNCCAALLSRRLTWRGTTYELDSPFETKVIKAAEPN